MRRPTALFPIALALGTVTVAPWPSAQAKDAREGPIEIEKCQTISHPGSYKLANNLTFTSSNGTCLTITANFVTIDVAGFAISGNGNPAPSGNTTTAVAAGHDTEGITVRNGSISGFIVGVDLGGDGSIVEGLRVISVGGPRNFGIIATGIVKGNTVVGIVGLPANGVGISATGIMTGNYVTGSRAAGIEIGQGSTVIGNTVVGQSEFGSSVSCPSNVTDNTFAAGNLNLVGNGCNNTNNVAP